MSTVSIKYSYVMWQHANCSIKADSVSYLSEIEDLLQDLDYSRYCERDTKIRSIIAIAGLETVTYRYYSINFTNTVK